MAWRAWLGRHAARRPYDAALAPLVRSVRIDPTGVAGPTRAPGTRARWRRTSRGLLRAGRRSTARLRRSSGSSRPRHALHGVRQSVTGWAALRWRGGRRGSTGPVGRRAPAAGRRRGRARQPSGSQPGDREVTAERHPAARSWSIVDGVQVVTPGAVGRASRCGTPRTRGAGGRAFDMACCRRPGLDSTSCWSTPQLLYRLDRHPAVLARRSPLVDENAWSPPEVDMRLVWPLDAAACAPPLRNRPVFDLAGATSARRTCSIPRPGSSVEYDGSAAPRRVAAGQGPGARGRLPRRRPRVPSMLAA